MPKVKTALISVSDKENIVKFAKSLNELNIEILSTSGTAKLIQENNIPIILISEYTGQKEILEGRIKTLHPKIYEGILAPEGNKDIKTINLVVVNLYEFEKNKNIENIDIGGVSLIRAAAKNFERVSVIVDKEDYNLIIKELRETGEVKKETRKKLMIKAFECTSKYDNVIGNFFKTRKN